MFVLIIFCMPIFCMLSKAQNYGTAKDYLLSKLAVTSTMPFQSFSWLNASCGNDYLLKELTRTLKAISYIINNYFILFFATIFSSMSNVCNKIVAVAQ